MNYYRITEDIILICDRNIQYEISEYLSDKDYLYDELIKPSDKIFYLIDKNPDLFRRSYLVDRPELLDYVAEDILLLNRNSDIDISTIDKQLLELIANHQVTALNISYPNWVDCLYKDDLPLERPVKLNIVGLGDVGGTLLTGLKLLGSDFINTIGIYDKDANKMLRYEQEMQQIHFDETIMPKVKILDESEIFNCDILAFTVASFIPPVGSEVIDVRMAQLEHNSKIINIYAKLARNAKFKGLFAILSDPVDQLCKVAFDTSNTNDNGVKDFNGLASDQIKGFGLGVMHARAVYHSKNNPQYKNYLREGRAYGPHGKGLVIANSIENYDETLSQELTQLTIESNLAVRALGYKPYIAPALSSGCLSLLATIHGEWHYSSVYFGGKFVGCKNRHTKNGVEIETLKLPELLINRLQETYASL